MLDIARLSLLRLHRCRKHQLITQASRLSLTISPGSLILPPILQGLAFYYSIQKAKNTCDLFAQILTDCGVQAEVRTIWAEVSAGAAEWLQGEGADNPLNRLEGDIKLSAGGMCARVLIRRGMTLIIADKVSTCIYPQLGRSPLPRRDRPSHFRTRPSLPASSARTWRCSFWRTLHMSSRGKSAGTMPRYSSMSLMALSYFPTRA
jgi:hypothetical protein